MIERRSSSLPCLSQGKFSHNSIKVAASCVEFSGVDEQTILRPVSSWRKDGLIASYDGFPWGKTSRERPFVGIARIRIDDNSLLVPHAFAFETLG
jgi:hypothetical protein